jgi:hypothetical protein
MMVRVPSNRSITPLAIKSSVALRGFLAGVAVTLRNGTGRPKFRLLQFPAGENLKLPPWLIRSEAAPPASSVVQLI